MSGRVTLYSLELSHPGHAARLMLERKGIEHRVVNLLPGLHPWLIRARGFRGRTVPALKLDGRRIQGSREISRTLDELQPEPRLLPSPAVEEAERWGEQTLQEVPRRAFRWGAVHDRELRCWIGEDAGIPLPRLAARTNKPVARRLASYSQATEENVRRDIAALPGLLDHVDSLIADGTLGGDEPNAADFQIGCTVRVLLSQTDLRSLVEGRPCAELGMRVLPEYPGPIPRFLPHDWL